MNCVTHDGSFFDVVAGYYSVRSYNIGCYYWYERNVIHWDCAHSYHFLSPPTRFVAYHPEKPRLFEIKTILTPYRNKTSQHPTTSLLHLLLRQDWKTLVLKEEREKIEKRWCERLHWKRRDRKKRKVIYPNIFPARRYVPKPNETPNAWWVVFWMFGSDTRAMGRFFGCCMGRFFYHIQLHIWCFIERKSILL